MAKNNNGGVNDILHKLRYVFTLFSTIVGRTEGNSGEQFRHLQNIKHSRKHLSTPSPRNVRVPTFPPSTVDYESSPVPASIGQESISWSGPAPPKSWKLPQKTRDRDSPERRTEALRIVALHMGNFPLGNNVPSLSLLCLQVVISGCVEGKEFREQIVPFIPNHLRRDLIRHCSIHSPLPAWKLDALLEPDGHVEGEIMVVGPTASPQKDLLHRIPDIPITDWEVDDQAFQPLRTLIFLTSSLATSLFLAIPPTLTILALIDVSSPQPLHRLPKLCPLLVILDLSYNSWLKDPSVESYRSFERIDWLRWGHLKILGLRECYTTQELLRKMEEGKWGDLDIIR